MYYSDWRTRWKVIRRFLSKHNEIPWYAIKAMRNLHAHDYDRVDLEIVWNTLTKDIPELKETIMNIK